MTREPVQLALEVPAGAGAAAAGRAVFRHPCASREIVLDGQPVAYALKRGKRRTIGFSVGPEGLAVSVPQWLKAPDIDQAVQRKAGWILKKLHQTRERQHRLDAVRMDWKAGATFAFLGEPVRLVLDVGAPHTLLHTDADADAAAHSPPAQVLRLALPPDAAPADIRQAVQAWLVQQARSLFVARLDFFAPLLDVQWRKLSLSSASTRWGSANSSGAIRLNWRLLHFRPAVIDYVVVHELSHLRFMDHSPRFWATVHSVMPEHAALRRQLKDATVMGW